MKELEWKENRWGRNAIWCLLLGHKARTFYNPVLYENTEHVENWKALRKEEEQKNKTRKDGIVNYVASTYRQRVILCERCSCAFMQIAPE